MSAPNRSADLQQAPYKICGHFQKWDAADVLGIPITGEKLYAFVRELMKPPFQETKFELWISSDSDFEYSNSYTDYKNNKLTDIKKKIKT
jgi:hypothetical protein